MSFWASKKALTPSLSTFRQTTAMEENSQILVDQGWRISPVPMYFLGFDISWLVMKEAFISPYDYQAYSFNEAMHIEMLVHPHHSIISRVA
jgi:hypothetical protein